VRVTCERDLRKQVGAIVAGEATSSLYAVHHFLISMNVLFGTPQKKRRNRAKSASQVHADVLLRNLSLIPYYHNYQS